MVKVKHPENREATGNCETATMKGNGDELGMMTLYDLNHS
jgi:hypothetical protein